MTRNRAEEECETLGEAYDEGYQQGRAELEPLINLLVSMETDIICEEMSTTDYCEQNCKYDCPQKDCYLRYSEYMKEHRNGEIDKKVIIKNEEVFCPHCKEYLFEEEFMWDFEEYKFCPYCGESITVKEQSNE